MELIDALRGRRTTKEFRADPVPAEQLDRILGAARWAPNHRMTQPWRFRVLGPRTLDRLVELSGDGGAKLLRAPTLVVASYVPSALPLHAAEDEQAAACAIYATLLAAQAEGVASYWRTPGILRSQDALDALGIPALERTLGLLHFGFAAGPPPEAPARDGVEVYVSTLD